MATFKKRKGYEKYEIYRVFDKKDRIVGIVGVIRDMLRAELMAECDGPPDAWVFIGKNSIDGEWHTTRYGKNREDVIPWWIS